MGVISLSSASVQEKGPVCPDDLNKSDYTLFIYLYLAILSSNNKSECNCVCGNENNKEFAFL